MLTKGILQLHPSLEKGVNLDRHINEICTEIIEKWIAKLPSRFASDEVIIRPESYQTFNREDGLKPIFISYWLDCSPPVFLKDFVKACSCPLIAYEVIAGLGQITYSGLEVWTPDVITDMNSYECWHGEVNDAAFIETFEDMHGEPFNQEEHGTMLPSLWYQKLRDDGYDYFHEKPKMTLKKLREYSATASPEEQVLIKALIKIRQLAKKDRVDHDDETTYGITQPAFLFLWDKESSEMLEHAVDEIVDGRYNSGEGRDAQFEIELEAGFTVDQAVKNLKAIEHLAQLQRLIGEFSDAIEGVMKAV